MAYYIHLWGVPVRVKVNARIQESNRYSVGSRQGDLTADLKWTYDRNEWRRRHGYWKTLWGTYRWDKRFPAEDRPKEKELDKIDALLDQAVAYWVQATASVLIGQLEREWDQKLHAIKIPERKKP